MRTIKLCISAIIFVSLFLVACSTKPAETTQIKYYPVDNLEGIIAKSRIEIDQEVSDDGNGSLRIVATKPTTVRLYETGDIDIENAQLIYRAKLRTQDIKGQAYLEMWCDFPEKGEFFSRAVQSALSGTHDWTSQETPFFFKKGENPNNVKLNLVINGEGTVWIDDIRLIKEPLP